MTAAEHEPGRAVGGGLSDQVARALNDWLAEYGIHDAGVAAIHHGAERVLAVMAEVDR